jgi:serine/threonine protein phosphatase PrpC
MFPLEIGIGWHPGIKRQARPNEDSVTALRGTCVYKDQLVPFGLFIVADGMGGHEFGQEASHIAVRTMTQSVLQCVVTSGEMSDELFRDILINGVQQAHEAIGLYAREREVDMGTTLTAAMVVNTKAYVVNVGDSRTYHYRSLDGLSQITRDHSLVAQLVATGAITSEEVYTHPQRSKLYRSLGDRRSIKVDSFTVDLQAGDWLLLCSDGLWEMVRPPEIERIMASRGTARQKSDMLVQAALQGGGSDNVSVIVARVVVGDQE